MTDNSDAMKTVKWSLTAYGGGWRVDANGFSVNAFNKSVGLLCRYARTIDPIINPEKKA